MIFVSTVGACRVEDVVEGGGWPVEAARVGQVDAPRPDPFCEGLDTAAHSPDLALIGEQASRKRVSHVAAAGDQDFV